jgi:DNA-binding CsgD family transcriptional regulator
VPKCSYASGTNLGTETPAATVLLTGTNISSVSGDRHRTAGAWSFRTGTAAFAFDQDLRIVWWNEAAAELLQTSEEEVLGRPCWEVLQGYSVCGAIECHRNCSTARLARDGWPVPPRQLLVRDGEGATRRVAIDTIATQLDDRPVVLHILRELPPELEPPANAVNDPEPPERPEDLVHLTCRQLEILACLADGSSARAIASRLTISEATVRNHIHAVLSALDAHSQLEAVVKAQLAGLL